MWNTFDRNPLWSWEETTYLSTTFVATRCKLSRRFHDIVRLKAFNQQPLNDRDTCRHLQSRCQKCVIFWLMKRCHTNDFEIPFDVPPMLPFFGDHFEFPYYVHCLSLSHVLWNSYMIFRSCNIIMWYNLDNFISLKWITLILTSFLFFISQIP